MKATRNGERLHLSKHLSKRRRNRNFLFFFQFLEHLLTPIISSGHLRAIDSYLALIFAHIIWTSPLLTVYHPKKISMTHEKWVTAYQKIDLRSGTASHLCRKVISNGNTVPCTKTFKGTSPMISKFFLQVILP